MDHPINHIAFKYRKKPHRGDLESRLEDAIAYDDKDQFLILIRDPEAQQFLLHYDFIGDIFYYDALEIALALFNGEAEDLIDLKDVDYQGLTQLEYAVAKCSKKLVKYFIERAENVDILCDSESMDIKQATLLDLALDMIDSGSDIHDFPIGSNPRLWSTRKSILELFAYLAKQKPNLDIIRMLVQNTSDKEHVRETFIDCANDGQLVRLSALFLTAPDVLLSHNASIRDSLSSIGTLYHVLNSTEKRTDIEEALLLLLDVFTLIGDKLVAYVRLEEYDQLDFQETTIAFLLDEVAHRKPGVSSPDDYYLRFFKPVRPEPDQLVDYPRYLPEHQKPYHKVDGCLFTNLYLKRKDITIHYINRIFRNRRPKPEEADLLYKAIDKKLSSMSTFRGLFEAVAKTTNNYEKHLPGWFPLISSITYKQRMQSFVTSEKPWINHKFTSVIPWEKKAIPQTKVKSFLSSVKLSYFPIIAKRLI